MKKSIIVIAIFTSSIICNAQEVIKQKEIALTFSGLYSYGLTYSFGNSNALWRFSTLYSVQAKSTTNYPTYDLLVNSMSAGASLGKEFRHSLSHKLFIRYGIELSFSYDHNYYKSLANEHEDFKYSPGINLLGGILYSISDNFGAGVLLLPYFEYQTGKDISNGVESDVSGFAYGLSSSSAQINLIVKF